MRSFLVVLCVSSALVSAARTEAAGLLTGAEIMTSTVMEEGQSSFAGLGARARLHPASLVAGLEIMPSIEYWRNSSTVNPYDIRSTRKDATLAVNARYNFHVGNWQPYAGAGYGVHFMSSEVDAPSFGLNNASDAVTKGGLSALGGLSFGLTQSIDNFIELEYHHIPDYRQLKINWGIGFKL